MNFKHWLETQYYHGTPANFDQFSYSFIGKGYDQEGPGFYFTSDENIAKHYTRGTGRIIKAQLNLQKTVPLTGSPKKREIVSLIKMAPNLEYTLTNWDEDPRVALLKAVQSILKNGDKWGMKPHEVFQSVWYEFYKGHEDQYLKNMVSLGYDGVIIPQGNNITTVVVFDPNKISQLK